MNLDQIYDEMNWNIIKRFIFYIPNNEYSKTQFDDKVLSRVDQKIFYLNGDKNVTEYPNINFLDFLNKEKLLQSNLFKLLEVKSQMDKDAFKLFHKTYQDKLRGWIYIANLVNKYIQRDIADCSKDVLTYVNYNLVILNEHLITIMKIVPITNEVESKIEKFDLSILEGLPIEIKSDFKLEHAKKPFIDFIKHEKKIEIERTIKAHYSDLKGVSLRYLIEFLKEEGVLLLNHGDATKLYNSMKILFGEKNIGAYTSIFDNKVFSNSDEKYINTKKSFTKIFKDIL